MPFPALLSVILLVTVDGLRAVSLGPVTLAGALSILGVVVMVTLIIPLTTLRWGAHRAHQRTRAIEDYLNPRGLRGGRVPLPLLLFVIWVVLRLVADVSTEGIQNVIVYVAFVLAIALTSGLASSGTSSTVLRWFRRAGAYGAIIYLLSLAFGLSIFSDRAFAMTALLYLAVMITERRGGWRGLVGPAVVTGAIILSLSRTATVIALILMVFIVMRGRRGRRLFYGMLASSTMLGAAYSAITLYTPLQDRFLVGDNAFSVGTLSLNTSGRIEIWETINASISLAPVWGHGAGSSTVLLNSTYRNIGHPHNDYLRILHDFGWVGLSLFVIGLFLILKRVIARVRVLDEPIHWAALLAVLSVVSLAITDNPLVYQFVMLPTAVLVGLSIGKPLPAFNDHVAAPPGCRIKQSASIG